MQLIIDGRNNLYRIIFACLAKRNKEYAESVIKSTVSYIGRFNPKSVHVAWDYDGLNWRKKIYPPYKDRVSQRAKWAEKYGVDAVEIVNSITPIVIDGLNLLSIRQYQHKYQEADDLIYSLCCLINEDITVISSDGDMTQLAQKFPNVKIFNPLKDAYEAIDSSDIVKIKCLKGDSSDNISGFTGIGHARAKILAEDIKKLNDFLDAGDGSRRTYYNLYEKLIDLSKNPFSQNNLAYVSHCLKQEVNNYKSIEFQQYLRKYKLVKLLSELRKFSNVCVGLV